MNGTDVRELRQEDLRAKIGFVTRKRQFFSPERLRRISVTGKDDATMEEVVHAARTAQAENFITEMKDGYDSLIAQGGNNVSGGQKNNVIVLSGSRTCSSPRSLYL